MEKQKIVIYEDNDAFRKVLCEAINSDDRLEVVGNFGNFRNLEKDIDYLKPDLVLMDIRMDGEDGVEATKAITERFPDIPVLMLTSFDDQVLVNKALAAGAKGYIAKGDSNFELIIEKIINTLAGEPAFTKSIGPSIYSRFTDDADPHEKGKLSKREQEILSLVRYYSYAEIAKRLGISRDTVNTHVQRIFRKLGVNTKAQAISRVFGR